MIAFPRFAGSWWRRGVYRLLVVLALAWGAVLAWAFYQDRPTEAIVARLLFREMGFEGRCDHMIDPKDSVCDLRSYLATTHGDAGRAFDQWAADLNREQTELIEQSKQDLQHKKANVEAHVKAADDEEASNPRLARLNASVMDAQARFDAELARYQSGEGDAAGNARRVREAKKILTAAKGSRDAELSGYRRESTHGITQDVADQVNIQLTEQAIKHEIEKQQQFRDRLIEYKAAFIRDVSELRAEELAHWLRPARIWLLSVLGVIAGIEAIAWVLRGFAKRA